MLSFNLMYNFYFHISFTKKAFPLCIFNILFLLFVLSIKNYSKVLSTNEKWGRNWIQQQQKNKIIFILLHPQFTMMNSRKYLEWISLFTQNNKKKREKDRKRKKNLSGNKKNVKSLSFDIERNFLLSDVVAGFP